MTDQSSQLSEDKEKQTILIVYFLYEYTTTKLLNIDNYGFTSKRLEEDDFNNRETRLQKFDDTVKNFEKEMREIELNIPNDSADPPDTEYKLMVEKIFSSYYRYGLSKEFGNNLMKALFENDFIKRYSHSG